MLCEQCGQREATSMVASSHICADGQQTESSGHLCGSCAEERDPRTPQQRMADKRAGFASIFAEMRTTLAERARTGSARDLARLEDTAKQWLADLASTNPDITIPEDLRRLIERRDRSA